MKLDGQWTYSICIIEGYSRKILAGMASEYQDKLAVLQLLHAAFSEYGCPEGLVSDVALWIYEDRLHIEYQQTVLARNKATLNRRRKSLKSVSQPKIYSTPFVSPQLELFELGEAEWRRAWLRPPYLHRQIQGPLAKQLPLLGLDMLL